MIEIKLKVLRSKCAELRKAAAWERRLSSSVHMELKSWSLYAALSRSATEEFLQMSPWGRASTRQLKEGLQRQEKGHAPGAPPSPSAWPVPPDLALDQRANKTAGWCECVCVYLCTWYISEGGLHILGGEATLNNEDRSQAKNARFYTEVVSNMREGRPHGDTLWCPSTWPCVLRLQWQCQRQDGAEPHHLVPNLLITRTGS